MLLNSQREIKDPQITQITSSGWQRREVEKSARSGNDVFFPNKEPKPLNRNLRNLCNLRIFNLSAVLTARAVGHRTLTNSAPAGFCWSRRD